LQLNCPVDPTHTLETTAQLWLIRIDGEWCVDGIGADDMTVTCRDCEKEIPWERNDATMEQNYQEVYSYCRWLEDQLDALRPSAEGDNA
jgi:hypothetical protein